MLGSLMNYRIQRFTLSTGERCAQLVNNTTGIPFIYQNLYVTIHHRNTGDSINTIIACLRDLKLFDQTCDYLNINLHQRFLTGSVLTTPEIESISYWAKKTIESLEEAIAVKQAKNIIQLKPKLIELSRHRVSIDMDLVASMTTYNRLTNIINYSDWFAKTLVPPSLQGGIEQMKNSFLSYRPIKKSAVSDSNVFKSLTQSQVINLLDVVRPDCIKNPWKTEAVRFRNQMIINVLHDIGCRKSELLNLKATDLDSGAGELKIRRSEDDPDDPRQEQPRVKTLGRDVTTSREVFSMIENYVIQYRSEVKGAGKTPFLILSHQKGSPKALPLSISGLNKIFRQLTNTLGFNVHPHAFRHTWNDNFSDEIEAAIEQEELSESEAEELRSYLMGWKENSGTAKTYTKRYHKKRALRVSLELQEKRRYKVNQIVGQYDEDIEI